MPSSSSPEQRLIAVLQQKSDNSSYDKYLEAGEIIILTLELVSKNLSNVAIYKEAIPHIAQYKEEFLCAMEAAKPEDMVHVLADALKFSRKLQATVDTLIDEDRPDQDKQESITALQESAKSRSTSRYIAVILGIGSLLTTALAAAVVFGGLPFIPILMAAPLLFSGGLIAGVVSLSAAGYFDKTRDLPQKAQADNRQSTLAKFFRNARKEERAEAVAGDRSTKYIPLMPLG